MLIKPVFSDHLSYVTLFQCFLERSHKTALTVYTIHCITSSDDNVFFYDFSYWYFQSVSQTNGCVGYDVKSNCTVTMGFCRKLKQKDTGCQDSSLCVETTNGTGEKVSYSVGKYGLSPFHVSSEGKYNKFLHVL